MATERHRLTDALRRARDTANELVNSLDADSFYEVGADIGDTKAPGGPIEKRWDERRFTALCGAHGVPVTGLGETRAEPALEVEGQFRIPLEELRAAWTAPIPTAMAFPASRPS